MLGGSSLTDVNPALIAIAVIAGVIAWSAILAVFFGRSLGGEFNDLLSLARGTDAALPGEASSAYHQMAGLLDERNRQVATLAQQAALVPIDEDPRPRRPIVVTTVASVMGDATWRCAVLASEEAALVPPGVYHALDDARRAEPIERARTLGIDRPSVELRHGTSRAHGARSSSSMSRSAGETRAILYAPWQGRLPPTRSELDLLTLIGQHAGISLEHSILYARVRSQADELNRMAGIQADFLRGVTHDLQTPLTSIGALATELRANAAVPDAARGDLDTITHQADRLRRMVSQLLVASRLEAGVLTPQSDVFAVAPIVDRTWAALRADRPFEMRGQRSTARWRSATPTAWSRSCGPFSTTPSSTARRDRRSVRRSTRLVPASWRSRSPMPDPAWTNATRNHAFEQFYRSDHARRDGARWQWRRPLRGARPDGGDGRLDRGCERARERHVDHAAHPGGAQRGGVVRPLG